MASIRSTGNKSTETKFLKLLRAAKIWGWRRHRKLKGNPDFVFKERRVAVFIDGCFWHGCPRCYKMPCDNRSYWKSKVESNRSRDRRNAKLLRSLGWKVIRVWEHTLKSAIGRERVLASLRNELGKIDRGRVANPSAAIRQCGVSAEGFPGGRLFQPLEGSGF
jgi:DNA mismatch endonuclease (patch repair protein)